MSKKLAFLVLSVAVLVCCDPGTNNNNRLAKKNLKNFKGSNLQQGTTAQKPAPATNSGTPAVGLYAETNPGQYSKVFAISDVHGMYNSLLPLLTAAKIIDDKGNWSAGNALLVVVGDSIDKGPDSVDVLKLWIKLMPQAVAAKGKIVHLIGNHEAELLSDPSDDKKAKELKQELKEKNIALSDFLSAKTDTGAMLLSMPIAARIGNWFFVHSGLVSEKTIAQFATDASAILTKADYNNAFLMDDNSVVEAKGWWVFGSPTRDQVEAFLSSNGMTGMVFGHQPSAMNVKDADGISEDKHLIKIDNGMAPDAGSHAGSVLVFSNPAQMATNNMPDVGSIHADAQNAGVSEIETEVRGPDTHDGDD